MKGKNHRPRTRHHHAHARAPRRGGARVCPWAWVVHNQSIAHGPDCAYVGALRYEIDFLPNNCFYCVRGFCRVGLSGRLQAGFFYHAFDHSFLPLPCTWALPAAPRLFGSPPSTR